MSVSELDVLRKVRALLAKAESTPFAEEAEAFAADTRGFTTIDPAQWR